MKTAEIESLLTKHNASYLGVQRGFGTIEDLILFNINGINTTGAIRVSEFRERKLKEVIDNRLLLFRERKGNKNDTDHNNQHSNS